MAWERGGKDPITSVFALILLSLQLLFHHADKDPVLWRTA